MILTCPSCATSYFTPDGAIPPAGRKVRCQSCAHVWLATNEEPLDLTAETAAPVESRSFEEAPAVAPETPAPELPKAFRARAEQQRRLRRAATHGVVWAGLASLFVGLIGAGWLFRVDVVQMYPRAAAAYAKIGSPVNAVGLEFEALSAKTLPNRPDTVVVSGALRNVRDREIVAPAVRVALLDEHGAEVGHAVIQLEEAPVLPGGVQGFAALIQDPGAHGVDVGVAFVGSEPSSHGEDAPAGGTHGPAPHARPLPTPDEHGLRPALIEAAPASHAEPVDAAPVVEQHHDAVDTHGAEAVSASHG